MKEFLKGLDTAKERHVYVSLYGLTSFDEIDDALFRATYPLLDNKGIQIAGRALKTLGKFFRIDPDLTAKDILNKTNANIFIFDDLERCSLPVSRTLGYINEFVEHEGRKVIVISNESEINEDNDYRRIREKVIGKTFEIQSAFEQASEAFMRTITNKASRKFLKGKKDEISTIYHQAELNNLRVLQQTLWDFERIHVALSEKHRESDDAMTALLRLLFALSFELKAGRFTDDDLILRREGLVWSQERPSRDENAKPMPFAAAQQRYPGVALDNMMLSDETLIDILIKGIVDREKIRTELDRSTYFVSVKEEPAWRTVWYVYERTEDQFNAAFAEMERAFVAREFERTGELLHVLGLRLWLSSIGALTKTRGEVVEEGKRYVDDLYANRRIEITHSADSSLELQFNGYAGLGIHEVETDEYKELYKYLEEKREQAQLDRRPAIAKELLDDMMNDPDNFFRRTNLINGGENGYYSIPVLAALETKQFVEVLLAQHPAAQRMIFMALQGRYQHGNLDRQLGDERPWANDVREKLLAASETKRNNVTCLKVPRAPER